MKINQQTSRLAFVVATSFVIFWFGRLSIQWQIHQQLPEVHAIEDQNKGVPTVEIENIKNAKLTGVVSSSDVRIISGDQIATAEEDLSFELDLQHLGYIGQKRPIIEHQIPDWAHFVASKNGKYYYALEENQAKRLSVPNRLYFETKEDAQAAGYLPRKG